MTTEGDFHIRVAHGSRITNKSLFNGGDNVRIHWRKAFGAVHLHRKLGNVSSREISYTFRDKLVSTGVEYFMEETFKEN